MNNCPCGLHRTQHTYCPTCGRPACASERLGIYLARLYPGTTFCQGCGRRSLHCTCERI